MTAAATLPHMFLADSPPQGRVTWRPARCEIFLIYSEFSTGEFLSPNYSVNGACEQNLLHSGVHC